MGRTSLELNNQGEGLFKNQIVHRLGCPLDVLIFIFLSPLLSWEISPIFLISPLTTEHQIGIWFLLLELCPLLSF